MTGIQLQSAGPAGGGSARRWLLLALALLWLLVLLQPLVHDDLWWQLARGRSIAQTGEIPGTNSHAYTLPAEKPVVEQAWLGELLLYTMMHSLGLPGLLLLRALLLGLSYALLALLAWRRSAGAGPAAALALLGAALVGAGSWGLRTQSFSLPLFAALLLILAGYQERRYGPRALLWLPALLALWSNLDGGFVAGLLLLGCALLASCWTRLRAGPAGAAPLGPLLAAALAALVASLLNPQGLASFAFAAQLFSTPVVTALPPDRQAPAAGGGLLDMLFYASLLAQPLVWRWRGRRPASMDLLALLLLAWLAFAARLWIPWYSMLLVPLLALALSRREQQPGLSPAAVLLAAVCLALLAWPPGRTALARSQHALQQPAAYSWLVPGDTPVAAVQALAQLRAQGASAGQLFHPLHYASYLIWALPQEQVFVDPRAELYTQQIWEDYSALNQACNIEPLLARYDIRRMLLDRQRQPALIAALQQHPQWELYYQDAGALIFVRR